MYCDKIQFLLNNQYIVEIVKNVQIWFRGHNAEHLWFQQGEIGNINIKYFIVLYLHAYYKKKICLIYAFISFVFTCRRISISDFLSYLLPDILVFSLTCHAYGIVTQVFFSTCLLLRTAALPTVTSSTRPSSLKNWLSRMRQVFSFFLSSSSFKDLFDSG